MMDKGYARFVACYALNGFAPMTDRFEDWADEVASLKREIAARQVRLAKLHNEATEQLPSIQALKDGSIVRHIVSGDRYVVVSVNRQTGVALGVATVEITNPTEWLLVHVV